MWLSRVKKKKGQVSQGFLFSEFILHLQTCALVKQKRVRIFTPEKFYIWIINNWRRTKDHQFRLHTENHWWRAWVIWTASPQYWLSFGWMDLLGEYGRDGDRILISELTHIFYWFSQFRIHVIYTSYVL